MSIAERLTEWLPVLWFLFAAVLLFGLWSSGMLRGLLARVTKFGGFGLEFEFTESSAKETRDSIEAMLVGARSTIQREIDVEVRASQLQDGLKMLLEASSLSGKDQYRATIHIPDPLFDKWLYQLLDYHPKGTGSGRTFSVRAGIIGLAWRLTKIEVWTQDSAITANDLIREWGMIDREAAARKARDDAKVMLAVPLTDPGGFRAAGVLYLDSTEAKYFGDDKDAIEALGVELLGIYQMQLSTELKALVESVGRRGPRLNLEEQ